MHRPQRREVEEAFRVFEERLALDGAMLNETTREAPVFRNAVNWLRPLLLVFRKQIRGFVFEFIARIVNIRQRGEAALDADVTVYGPMVTKV
jgi:hypothetical protein